MWAGLARLQPVDGERIHLIVFARDSAHWAEIQEQLRAYRLSQMVVEFSDLSQSGGDLAIAVVSELAWRNDDIQYRLIRTLSDLGVLGKFLQIPDISFRAWERQIQNAGFEEYV